MELDRFDFYMEAKWTHEGGERDLIREDRLVKNSVAVDESFRLSCDADDANFVLALKCQRIVGAVDDCAINSDSVPK